jgi:TfoX/Sxy family transcriptional regulator of competence genes
MTDENLLACVRAALAGNRAVREVKMFGGVGFMLNGNLLVAASKRGLLVRVGKQAENKARARPGAAPMIMRGRTMAGYIRVDMARLNERSVAPWIELGGGFVRTLPKKKKPARRTPAARGKSM